MELPSTSIKNEVVSTKLYYGWAITFLAGLMYCVKSGILTYGMGPINDALIRTFGWSNTEIGIAFSLSGLFFWLTPIAGWVTVKFGPRLVLGLSGILISLALFATAFVTKPWHFILTKGIAMSIVSAFTITIPITALVNNWWESRRGLHNGIVNSFGGLGSIIFVPIVAWLLVSFGWKTGIITLAVILLVFAVIPQWILFRNYPEEKGQKIDNGLIKKVETEKEKESNTKESKLYKSSVNWLVKDALRTYQLWFIMLTWATISCAFVASSYYAFPHLRDIGLSVVQVSAIQGSLGIFTILSSLAAGFFVDRIGARGMMIIASLLNGLGILILIFTSSAIMAWMYAIVFGLATGIIIPCITTIIPAYFGNERYASIMGSLQWIIPIAAGSTPLIAGILADATGGFKSVFIFATALCVLGVIMSTLLRPPNIPKHYMNNPKEV